MAETCDEENAFEIITDVEVTASSGSDAQHTVPTIDKLAQRDIQPDELVADTTYGSAENSLAAERLGTELISPVPGNAAEPEETEQDSDEPAPLTVADFKVDANGDAPTICPEGHPAIDELEGDDENSAVVFFDPDICEACPQRSRCPARLNPVHGAGFFLKIDLKAANRERRRRAQASGEFAPRYRIRAGIEATNSELKRRHGLGHIRVRGRPRVELAVYFKAVACNIKRMIAHLLAELRRKTAPLAG